MSRDDYQQRKQDMKKPQKFTSKTTCEAMQFDGTNGREIVEWLKAHDIPARNGGRWLKAFIYKDIEGAEETIVRKLDVIWIDGFGQADIGTGEQFAKIYKILKSHDIVISE